MQYLIILVALALLEAVYFRVADHYNIIDRPSERGSSTRITRRGGGIIVPIGALIFFGVSGFSFPWFMAGLMIVSVLSFVDDVHSLTPKFRLPLQFVGMLLLLLQLAFMADGASRGDYILLLFLGLIVCTGAMNIYNFMDGINGITGGYSLVALIATLIALQQNPGDLYVPMRDLVVITILADLVFCFCNFRRRALCFAGDVGAVSIAFIILFAIGYLIITTNNVAWLAFLVVYGVDGCFTILHRLMLHENISLPHRKHLYQLMANELHIPHVTVSLIYMAVQAACCAWIIACPTILTVALQVAILGIVYVLFMKKYFHLHKG